MTHPDKLRDRLHALPTPSTLVPPPDLADAVLMSARRRSRAGWIGGAAAAVVAVGVATPYILQPGAPEGAQIEVAGPATTTATTTPANADKLVPGPAPSLGMFPFTPGQPHAYRLGRQGAGMKLTSSSNNRHIPSGPDVYVAPDPALPDDGKVTGTTPITVRDKPATVTRMTGKVKVSWQEQPGQWVVVSSPSLPEAEVVSYAQALRPQPQPIPMPLDFAWLPAGMKVAATSDGAVDESVAFTSTKGNETIVVGRTGNEVGKVGDPVPVGDRTGLISHQNGVTILWVPLPGQGNIDVAVPDTLGFSQQDLVRFAMGISNP